MTRFDLNGDHYIVTEKVTDPRYGRDCYYVEFYERNTYGRDTMLGTRQVYTAECVEDEFGIKLA